MRNKYEVRGEVTAVFINSKTYGIIETLIDTEDLDKVCRASSWRAIWCDSTKSYYVRGIINGSHVRLHRYVLNVYDPKLQVDHIFHNTLDNRKSHLRIVTSSENAQNRRKRKDCNSGHPGINWHKASGKWEVRIMVDGSRKHIGIYSSISDAIKARKNAEQEYFRYKQSLDN